MGDSVVRVVGKIVVVGVELDDLIQTAGGEAHRFFEHLIDGGAVDDGEVSQIVVVGLVEERFLLDLLRQFDQFQKVMLRKLAPPLIIHVDLSNAVPVESCSPILALLVLLHRLFNFRLALPARRPEPHPRPEGQGQSGASECGRRGCAGAEQEGVGDERAHHYY